MDCKDWLYLGGNINQFRFEGEHAMRMYDLITKKKAAESLTKQEIQFIIEGYTKGTIPDYQMSAFLMAVCLKGMSMEETTELTMAMAHSGDMLDLSKIEGVKVDKHSTGGVGDKTSLVIGPMVAALGIPVAKMSGRGLGHTGGTIDKLESFEGLSTNLSEEQFFENVNRMKFAIAGQTANLAPADKKIYALRDVTATVDNISLIASSIMSKKIAAGADVIVLDVKTGSGAFMKTLEGSFELAQTMVDIGNHVGRQTYAVISDMNQPLGSAVGNNLEVIEAIETLQGHGPEDLLDASLTLASYMVVGAGAAKDAKEARTMLLQTIENHSALEKFAEFVRSQGGKDAPVFDVNLFPKAKLVEDVSATKAGYISNIHTDEIGITSLILGGGRETKESEIDLTVGLKIHKKIGDYVEVGTSLATLYANDAEKLALAKERLINSYTITPDQVKVPSHIYGIVTKDGITKY